MSSLDWPQCSADESVPGQVSGAWVFKGTRLAVATVIENLKYLSIDEAIEQFDVTHERVTAALEFVAVNDDRNLVVSRISRVGTRRRLVPAGGATFTAGATQLLHAFVAR